MKVFFFSCREYEIPFLKASNLQNIEVEFCKEQLSIENWRKANGYDAIAVFSGDDLSKEVLVKLSGIGIKLICLRSTGFNHVDLEEARALKIRVANVPSYSPEAIAEHAILLILALSRKITICDKRIRKNNFSLSGLIGFNLGEQTVGVIGTGKIGSAFIKMLSGFGSKILAFDLKPDVSLIEKYDVEYLELNDLLKKSDIISLHLPLNPSSKYMIDVKEVNQFKDRAILINTGRGKLVNTMALIEGLRAGKIGGLGLDVYENEESCFFKDLSDSNFKDEILDALLSFENVIVTGHQAFLTKTAISNIAATTFLNITNYRLQNWNDNFLV